MSGRALVTADWSTYNGLIGRVVSRSFEDERAMLVFDDETDPVCFGFEALVFLGDSDVPPPTAA